MCFPLGKLANPYHDSFMDDKSRPCSTLAPCPGVPKCCLFLELGVCSRETCVCVCVLVWLLAVYGLW